MNSQERRLVDDLFDRLAQLESAPRDADASTVIAEGLRRAPNATYALVQTVLVQDEALQRANARIQELEDDAPERKPSGGFLDTVRDTLLGPGQSRGSVPTVRGNEAGSRAQWNTGRVLAQDAAPYGGQNAGYGAPQPAGAGGSFLGTAAAAAAGMIGGSLLLNSIRGMMGGGGQQQSFGDTASAGDKNPWSTNPSGGDLARDAGVNDIGKAGKSAEDSPRQGFSDHASNEADDDGDNDDDYDDGDGDTGGDSDFA